MESAFDMGVSDPRHPELDESDISRQNDQRDDPASDRRICAAITQANCFDAQIGARRQHGGIIHPRSTRKVQRIERKAAMSDQPRPSQTRVVSKLDAPRMSKRPVHEIFASLRKLPLAQRVKELAGARCAGASASVRRNEMNSHLRGQMDKLLRQEIRQERRAS